MSDFAIVLRSLRARLFSTAVTAITVAIAVALLMTLLSLQKAGNAAFTRGSGNADLLVSADAGPMASVLNAIFYASPPQRPLTQAKLQEIATSFPWEFVIPLQQGDNYRGFPTLATAPEFFSRFEPAPGEPWVFREGRPFTQSFEAVLGAGVVEATGLRLGAKLLLTHGTGDEGHVHKEYEFTVVGILAPTGSAHDRAIFTDLASSWILHAHDRRERELAAQGAPHQHGPRMTEADLLDEDRLITGVLLKLPTRQGSVVSAALQSQFDRLRRDPTITVASPSNEVRKLFAIVSQIDVLFLALAIAILVSSSISILVALYNSMHERRRQIALFRVLGASRGRVFSMVLTESALIGLAGGVLGIAASTIGIGLAGAYLERTVGLSLALAVDPRSAIVVLAGTAVLAALAGLLPASLAYRTPVGEVLRPSA